MSKSNKKIPTSKTHRLKGEIPETSQNRLFLGGAVVLPIFFLLLEANEFVCC